MENENITLLIDKLNTIKSDIKYYINSEIDQSFLDNDDINEILKIRKSIKRLVFNLQYKLNENKECYSNTQIDKSRYSVVNIDSSMLSMSTEEMKEQGFIFAPYIMGVHTEKSSKRYDKFMKKKN